MELTKNTQSVNAESLEDSIVCYCYKLTTKQLKDAYRKCGSLKGVEESTRAGTGCTGCKIILQSLFGEAPSSSTESVPTVGTSCVKPGNRTMKGLIIATGDLNSRVQSSNAVAPQLGDCDSTTEVEYTLLDHRGVPLIRDKKTLLTNETFVFDTKDLEIERPFVGTFFLKFNRSNYGASRFNVYWYNDHCTTATHENSNTGRPIMAIPILVNKGFLDGPNTIHLALTNPHATTTHFTLTVYDVNDRNKQLSWQAELPAHCSTWINANEFLYGAALEKYRSGRFALKLNTSDLDMHHALSSYFFVHHRDHNIWTSNHL